MVKPTWDEIGLHVFLELKWLWHPWVITKPPLQLLFRQITPALNDTCFPEGSEDWWLFFPSFGSEATAFEREIFCFPASPQTADKNFTIIQTISFELKITEPTGDVMKKTFLIRQRMLLFTKNINIMRQRKQEM